ncbi:serine/arginine repetitive matrix 1 [Fagus crenata]
MEDSSPYTKTHYPFPGLNNSPIRPNPRCQGKSFTHFLFKALFFAMFLLVLPLFPSQAPDFISQTILTKFWELIHLLFIGIAVSYGLFSRRRNEQMGIDETHSNFDNSLSYVSRMLHVTSVFEDGFENPCGSDEKRVSSQYFDSEHMPLCSNSNTVVEEQCEPQFSMSKNGFENPYGCDQNNVVQAWNSQYFQGESMVVVAQPNYGFDEFSKPGSVIDYKPLGLPVRSLKSRVRKRDGAEFISGSESSSGSNGSSRNSDSRRRGNFGDLGPMNLEQNFDDAAAAAAAAVASSIPWRSRSMRKEMREKVGNVNRPAHFRPLSVDETQFESIKSQSFRPTRSFSSQNCSVSSSHSISSESPNSSMDSFGKQKSNRGAFQTSSVSSSHSISSEPPNSSMDSLGKQKSNRGAFPEASPSPPIPTNGKGSLNALHSRHYSIGSASGRDVSRSSEDESKEWSKSNRGAFLEASPSPPIPTNGKGSLNALHSRHYSIGSASGRDVSRSSEDESKEWSKSNRGAFLEASPSPPIPTNGKGSLNALHSRHYSIGSASGRDFSRSSEDESKEWSRSSNESSSDSLELNKNPASLTKASLRGKSVRTIRASRLPAGAMKNEEICQNQIDDKTEKSRENLEEAYMRKDKTTVAVESPTIGTSKRNLDNLCPMPNATHEKYHSKGEFSENVSVGYEQDSESETENIQVSSDEDAVPSPVNDAGPYSDEVDKKAGEFIAKFKQQIRLQKMASIERSRGPRMGGNYFR